MTEFKSSVKVVQPESAYMRYNFVDADTGECIFESKKGLKALFNVCDGGSKQFDDVVNSFLRGFMSGRNLALVIELVHPVWVDELSLDLQ